MNEEPEQEARIALLQYYSSKCTAHGTNILAIVIAFFAWVQAQSILPFPEYFHNWLNGYIFAGFLVLSVHQAIRLFVWGKLTNLALWVPFSGEMEKTRLHRLNDGCFEKLRRGSLLRIVSYSKRFLGAVIIIWILLGFVFSQWFF